ncbi:hAD superfamily (Subfamily IA) hydrolase TIGR02254 [Ruminococcus sp. CAG:177]|jgi:2-haloacid dehalogenase|nr:hAD superfamily (Subfamily IA) hydrolase TIGR02254 [Ruminococcus sp. CAG:177]
MIRNVLFDLDDTLFDFHKAEKIALTKTLVHFGIDPTEETLALYSTINAAHWKRLELGEISREEVKVGRYRELFETIGVECDPVKATAYYESMLAIGHYFMPGAPELLEELYRKYRLYIVSNGTAKVQEGRIGSSGITKYMDGIFISQILGANKPDKQFFDICFAEIPDFLLSETVIIGDSLSSDIKGGINAGITTVWFNPKGIENDSDIKPDYTIKELSEVPGLLSQISAKI